MYQVKQGIRPNYGYQVSTTYKNFTVTAIFKGDKDAGWDNLNNSNNYKVTVRNTETGQKATFDFWASIANPELEGGDVLNCLHCFVSDAISGQESFSEFCSELGYDTDSRQARKTWKACQKSAEKLDSIYDGDIYDLVNELSEIAG